MCNNQASSIFPNSAEAALAMLYVKSQDLTGKTAAEIYTMYQEAYFEILKDKRKKNQSGWFKNREAEVLQY